MPIYEYTCEDCRERSELLMIGKDEAVCPKCGSKHMHKEFSTFTAPASEGHSVPVTGSGHAHGPGCGCCMGPQGSCGLN